MDSRVNDNLQRLNRYLLQLKNLADINKDDFIENDLYIASAERYLHLAIESCLNIGNRILSLEQFNKTIRAPESYADIFRELAKIEIISVEFSEELIRMAKYRNRLVHIYWEIQSDEIYEILQTRLGDFEKFMESIWKYYNNGNKH